jgi:murein DD-endopeptidase MepM/ murein hydrolase activator NlpD
MAQVRARNRPKPEREVILVAGGGKLTRKQWRKFEQVGLRPELDLDELVLNWSDKKVKDLEAHGAITGVQIEATLEGAPTVTINLRDPERRVFRRRPGRVKKRKRARGAGPVQVDEGWDPILPPDVLGQPMQISLDGVTYQLVKAAYQEGSGELQLTFEHELVYMLKRHKGAKRAPREKVTRAQFILSLLRELEPELRKRRYRFVCPELDVKQSIDGRQRKKQPATTRTTASSSGGSGGSGRSLDRVYPRHSAGEKGVQFTPAQVRACAAAGGFWGQELKAMEQIARGESNYYPGVVSFDQGYGLWQMTPRVWGAEALGWLSELGGMRQLTNPIVNAKLAHRLYVDAGKSFSPWYGTGFLTVGAGPGNGNPSRAESRELAATVTEGGTVEGTASTKTVTETKSYQFARGRKESSHAAIQRLASEVKWRAFIVGNTYYYMSEEGLYARRPRYEIGPDHDGVIDLAYDVDWGKTVSEATLNVVLSKWGAPPGSVVLLEGYGPPDGRWLVASVSRDYFAPTAEVKLVQPAKPLLEPANETKSRTVRTGVRDGDGDGGRPSGKTSSCWPGKKPVTGAYGTDRGDHIHSGLDVGMPVGTPCIAPFDGTITFTSSSGFGLAGGMAHLRADRPVAGLDRGDKVGWGHGVSWRVKAGQKVTAGQRLGVSNYAQAPHVHFVLIKAGGGGNGLDGNADPSNFLRQTGSI